MTRTVVPCTHTVVACGKKGAGGGDYMDVKKPWINNFCDPKVLGKKQGGTKRPILTINQCLSKKGVGAGQEGGGG